MAELNEKEIRRLCREIERQGLTYTELQQELLDHLCCDVEAEMDEGLEFIKALEKVRRGMGEGRIQQIQEETLLLVNQKYSIMKKFMYILGMVAPAMLITGTIFKIQHWPGSGILLVISLFLLGAIYLPVFVMVKIRDTRKAGKKVNMPMYVIGLAAGMIFIAGAMFKIQHWPGAGIMIMLSGFVTLFVFIPILVVQAIYSKENQVQNFTILIFVLCFLAITFMMYALRVTQDVLHVFTLVAEDHVLSTQVIEARNRGFIDMLEASPGDSALVLKAKEIQSRTDVLDHFIKDLIVDIVLRSDTENQGAVDMDGNIAYHRIENKDQLYSVKVGIFGDGEIPGKGEELLRRINEYREFLRRNADPALSRMIDEILDTGLRFQTPWLEYCFESAPMIGAVDVLTQLQSDIRVAEGQVLSQLLNRQMMQD